MVCTEEFRMITLQVGNDSHLPATLDEVYTLRTGSTQKLYFDQPFTEGRYVVLDDSYHSHLKNKEADFRFIGIKNNTVVVDQVFRIAGDNCHIIKKSGPDGVMVN